jgi:hypothetical protein
MREYVGGEVTFARMAGSQKGLLIAITAAFSTNGSYILAAVFSLAFGFKTCSIPTLSCLLKHHKTTPE